MRHHLDMGAIGELIDGLHRQQSIAAIHQGPGVAGEGRGVARHADHARHIGICQIAHLIRRTRTRRIEHHGVEFGPLPLIQGLAAPKGVL